MKRFRGVLGGCLLGAALLVGNLSVARAASSYTLTASGTWQAADAPLNGTWQAHFDIAGFDLSGTLNVLGLPDVGEGNIAGSWDLGNFGFGVMFLNQELASFTGSLVGDRLVGTFEAGNIIGNWSGALSSLSLSKLPIEPVIDGTLPTLVLDHASGNLGDLVKLAARLYTLGAPIAAVENVISFDSLSVPIVKTLSGLPDCAVNPFLNKADTLFEFLPKGCSGSACQQVRALVQSLSNNDPIPDGATLYTCKVQILKNAEAGIYQVIANALRALDINSLPLPISAVNGEIAAKLSWFKQLFAGGHGCHCSTTAGSLPVPGLIVPLALIVLRRRRRKPS